MSDRGSLFPEVADVPETEGLKYAGSKLKLLAHILDLAQRTGARTVLDGFSGTTRVSQALASRGCTVVANDVAVWSEVLGTCYLLNRSPRASYKPLIDHLNSVTPVDGWFTAHYGDPEPGRKKPWQRHNTRKLDGIRDEIDRLALPPVEKAVAVTSLMLALDRVDSTLGHFVSYLKDWSPRSYGKLRLDVPAVTVQAEGHRVVRGDVFDVAGEPVDLAYFDPPYGSNNEKMPPSRVRYASYYHVWKSVCLNDKPVVVGKANRRADVSDRVASSCFEEFRKSPSSGRFLALEAIDRLIRATEARWILLSYSSGGRATGRQLEEIIAQSGHLAEVVQVDHRRNVMAHMRWTNEWSRNADEPHREFLFLIEKSRAGQRR